MVMLLTIGDFCRNSNRVRINGLRGSVIPCPIGVEIGNSVSRGEVFGACIFECFVAASTIEQLVAVYS